MKRISLLILCCSIIGLTTFAQKGANKCGQLKKMKTELKEHYTTQMTPELQTIHAKLMSQLSEEDQATVKTLQEKQKALLIEKKKLKKAAKNSEENSNKQDKQNLRAQQREINQALKPLVQRNKAAIEAADAAMKTKNVAWKTERKAIKDKYAEYECIQVALEKEKTKGRKKLNTNQRIKPYNKDKKDRNDKKGGNKKMKKSAAFLLWTPKDDMMPQNLNEAESTN